jgi:hypothetical protein
MAGQGAYRGFGESPTVACLGNQTMCGSKDLNNKISTADKKPPLLIGAGGFFIVRIPGANPKGNTP